MIGWLILAVYVAGWLPAAVRITQLAMRRPHCHGESRSGSGYRWGYDARTCRTYCQPTCWRGDDIPGLPALGIGTGLAFLWPLALLAGVVYHFAASGSAPTPPRLMSERDLDRLERDLGIGGQS